MRNSLLILVGLLIGCTDAQVSNFTALGQSGIVVCYSGGDVIYSGKSTGKIVTTKNSDGWEFREEGTNHFIRVSGDCVVTN
jgi:hypothetical protein